MFTSRSKGIHNHIKTLGLNEMGEIFDTEDSIIGQNDARRAAGLIVEMARSNKYGGKCFLLTGPSGSGKTALTVAISEELGVKVPFVSLSACEVNSKEVKKSEILEEYLRRSVLVRIKEFKDIYEGEVVNIRESLLDLRSLKGTKTLKLSLALQDQMNHQDIKIGDVVHIDSTSGIIKRMGRGESHLNDYDLEAEKYVPLPKNEIYKKREFHHETTLHNLDISLVNPTGQDVLSLVHQVVKNRKVEITDKLRKEEITDKLRKEVDILVKRQEYEIVSGILLIEDAHMLDIESYTYLYKALDSSDSPLIILSSSLTDNHFGIPEYFLKKCLIIPMQKNDREIEIIKCRLNKDGVEIDEDGVKALESVCDKNGLIYTINLSKMLRNSGEKVTRKDVEELAGMFGN